MNGCLLMLVFLTLYSATGQLLQASVKITGKPLGRLDLMECAVLEPAEYDRRAAVGLCPPRPTRTAKTFQNKLKKLLHGKTGWSLKKQRKQKEQWMMKKKILLRAVFLGKQSFYKLQLQSVNFDSELLEGLFLVMECPTKKKVKRVRDEPNIEWYLDGLPVVTDSRLSWRVKITPLKHLEIWPLIISRDDGRYECFIDGKPQGSVTVHIITVSEGLRRGLTNYLITMMLAVPFVTFAVFYRSLHPQREAIMLDNPVSDFYEKILDLKTKEMKGNIARTVYKDKEKFKRKEIQSTYSSSTRVSYGKHRSNRDTVMTIVNVAERNQRKKSNSSRQEVKSGLLNFLK